MNITDLLESSLTEALKGKGGLQLPPELAQQLSPVEPAMLTDEQRKNIAALLPGNKFIDETEATLFRAHGYALPNKASKQVAPSVHKPPMKRKYHRRQPVVHNDGYDWRKFGQKDLLCTFFFPYCIISVLNSPSV